MPYQDPWLAPEPGTVTLMSCRKLLLAGFLSVASGGPMALSGAQQVPLPTPEPELTGSIGISNRWRSVTGNEGLYRSTVDLGSGPKLDSFGFSYVRDPDRSVQSLVDSADIQASSWGGEPASGLRAEWGLEDTYRATVNYRRIAYFNMIGSFANPSPDLAGATQQWLDVDRGLLDAELILRPGKRIVPFLNVSRDSSRGPGRTTFTQDGNEFAVSSETDSRTNTFRGGAYLRFDRWNGIVEAGGSRFRDNQSIIFEGDSTGNRSALFLGRRLRLRDLDQAYRARGDDRFARVRLEGRVRDDVTLFGQFAFSQPSIDLDYSQTNNGDFVLFQTLGFFTSETATGVAHAAWPRPSASIGVEYRPTPRLRIVDTVWLDRFHVSGTSLTQRTLSGGVNQSLTEGGSGRLESRLTRHRFDATFALNRRLSVYGNHTYMTASALSPGSELAPSERRSIDRHTLGLGVSARPVDRIELRSDVEVTRGDEVFFRGDRRRYTRLRIQGRYRAANSLNASVSASAWNNTNDITDIDLRQRNRDLTLDIAYTPDAGGLTAIHTTYTRSTFSSDTRFLIPQNFRPGQSTYRDRGHTASLTAILRPYRRVELDLGGRFFVSTDGTDDGERARPTRFYNGGATVEVEFGPRIFWNAGWQWYEYKNRSLANEAFQTHLFSTGFTYAF